MATRRLKIKDTLNYRPGGTSNTCGECNYFVRDFKRHGIGGDLLGEEPRCINIGLEHSTNYRVNPRNCCDLFDHSVYMLRLMGDAHYREVYGTEKYIVARQARRDRELFDKSREY